MIVKPNIRGFICTTAHPIGCFENVKRQIEYIKLKSKSELKDVKKGGLSALIIGASAGYGLSSRIVAAFLKGYNTLGIIFEKPARKNRTATAGWYNTAAFEKFAQKENLYAKTINADAFSKDTMQETANIIKKDLGKIDLIIYSLAAPRRTMPNKSVIYSVLKTIGKPYENKTINMEKKEIFNIKIPVATKEEIENTVKVMGGENLKDWVEFLKNEKILSNNANIISFSYEGPELTHEIYKNGTIGKAKQHLLETTNTLNKKFSNINAYISVNKALVTQSSSAIPVVPLYISILYKIMKEENLHEETINQMYRLFNEKLRTPVELDAEGKIRLDDFEMLPNIQQKVELAFNNINSSNVEKYADIKGYTTDFLHIFGFAFSNINYNEEVDVNIQIPSIN